MKFLHCDGALAIRSQDIDLGVEGDQSYR